MEGGGTDGAIRVGGNGTKERREGGKEDECDEWMQRERIDGAASACVCVQKRVCEVYILVLALCMIKDLVGEMVKSGFVVKLFNRWVFNLRFADSWWSVKVSQEVLDLNFFFPNFLKMLNLGQR